MDVHSNCTSKQVLLTNNTNSTIYMIEKKTRPKINKTALRSLESTRIIYPFVWKANGGSNFSLEGASRWSSKGEKSMISRRWRQSLTNIPSRRGPRCLFTVLDPCPLGAASLSPKIIARHGCRHEATEMEMENPGNSVVSHRRGRSCCRGGRTGPRVRRQICLVRVRIVPGYAPISRYGISAILLRRIGEPLVPSFFFWCLTSFH